MTTNDDAPELPADATPNDAVRYVRALTRYIGPGFHPDEDFNNYVDIDTGERCFSQAVAQKLNDQLDRAIDLITTTRVNVYDVAIRVQQRLLREMGYWPALT